MSKFPSCAQPDAAGIASHALYAFCRGDAADRQEALAKAERLTHQMTGLDATDAERIDVLHSALQALTSSRQEQIQAGIYLLEHLASRPQIA